MRLIVAAISNVMLACKADVRPELKVALLSPQTPDDVTVSTGDVVDRVCMPRGKQIIALGSFVHRIGVATSGQSWLVPISRGPMVLTSSQADGRPLGKSSEAGGCSGNRLWERHLRAPVFAMLASRCPHHTPQKA